jgi:integrase/recombinase XerC
MKTTKSIVKATKTSLVNNQVVEHEDIDVLAMLLEDKRSAETKRAYQGDIRMFFEVMFGTEPTREAMKEFLGLSQGQAIALVIRYKGLLIKSGLKEATINRRLAAVKSLAKYARKVGHCNYALEDVSGEKTKSYRDTSGISQEEFKKVLASVDRNTQSGKRDFAILLLLWTNALRRGEISKLLVEDFDYGSRSLWILGKGKGTSKERVEIPKATAEAIACWLATRKPSTLTGKNTPLFVALDFYYTGHGLTGDMISKLVQRYCKLAGITKKMSAHRIRHSSITSALDATDGNIRKVQKLSRHSKVETVMIYDDNRNEAQGEISDLLADGIF